MRERIVLTSLTSGEVVFEGDGSDVSAADIRNALYSEFGTPEDLRARVDPDTASDMLAAYDDMADYAAHNVNAEEGESALHYLALDLTAEEAEIDLPRWPREYGPYLSEVDAQEITRSTETRALTISGEMGAPTDLVRMAYIKRVQGRAAVTAAEREANRAEDEGGEAAARKAVAAAFKVAYAHARKRWEADHADARTGRRMAGPILLALRTAMGLSQDGLAGHLRVSRETVRDWEAGRYLVPVGATREVWGMWDGN